MVMGALRMERRLPAGIRLATRGVAERRLGKEMSYRLIW